MQLRDFLSYEEIYIQCHDSPDADALASGFGLYTYFRNHGIKTHLIYTGRFRIRKTNLVLMVEKLNIPVEYVEEGTLRLTDELLLTVDSQYGAGNITKIPAEHIGIIDHHQIEARNFPDSLILSDFGSCSTVVWKLLCEEQFDPNDYPDLATALYYGLYSDTQQFTEVHNPADKDMHDALKYRNSVFSLLKNSNISSSELEIASIAILRAVHNKEKRYSLIKSEPCDPNILGLISDLCIQVDSADVCVVYNELPDGIKFSVRSCTKETKACDLAAYLAGKIGSGGGHLEKSGGFINRWLYKSRYGSLRTEDYFSIQVQNYLNSFDILDARTSHVDHSRMKSYRRRQLPVGYVQPTQLLPSKTPITIRTIEGDLDLIISEQTYIMIDLQGKVSVKSKEDFHEHYLPTKDAYHPKALYLPTIKNRLTGTQIRLSGYIHSCIPLESTIVQAYPLERACKLFPLWDEEKYLPGNIGDYLVALKDQPGDLFIVEKEVFEQTYELI